MELNVRNSVKSPVCIAQLVVMSTFPVQQGCRFDPQSIKKFDNNNLYIFYSSTFHVTSTTVKLKTGLVF